MNKFITMLSLLLTGVMSYGQDIVMVPPIDTMMKAEKPKYCNDLTFQGKYFFNAASETQELLSSIGFNLNEPALELQIRYKNLPKLCYYHQIGTVVDGKGASIIGFSIKEDVRYSVINHRSYYVTPYIEVGGGYYRLTTVQNLAGTTTTSILTGKAQSHTVDALTITGDVGVDLGFGTHFDGRRLSLILSGGYMTNYPAQWSISNAYTLKEKFNILSPYVGIGLALEMDCASGCCTKM
jgi:hypothetical protein